MFELRMSTNTRRTSTNYIKSAAVVHLSTLKELRMCGIIYHRMLLIFINILLSRVSILTRDIANLSVCLSVRPLRSGTI